MSTQQPNKRVLIVDDEDNVTLVLSRSLAKLGDDYVIETANDSEEALEKIKETAYSLVITDYRMPDMNGVDLAMAIRNLSPQTQVVLMTAYGDRQLKNLAGNMELAGYLDKPFSMKDIRRIVEQAIGQTRSEDPYRTGERSVDNEVFEHLETLQMNTGARCIMLLSSGGYPIEAVGGAQALDLSTVGALVAANFAAAVELSKLLGNDSIFKSSYHEGPDYNIYAYDVNGDALLAVIFGNDNRPGTVWFYTKQTATNLKELLEEQAFAAQETLERGQSDADLDADLENFSRDLDKMFGGESNDTPSPPDDGDDSQEHTLLNLDEAIKAGIVSTDISEHNGHQN
jgi:CheY-like chemotaxis protein/predicted regulator of Ras-like GTPase activity (Roadblock/LC7/MglB family)